MNQPKIQQALLLHKLGCRLVICCAPHHEPGGQCTVARKSPCNSPGKAPLYPNWQNTRLAEDHIRSLLEKYPDANIGVRWGESSNLVDVECDSEEAEIILQSWLDDFWFPELQLIPTYKSSRGLHRLFKFTQGLPQGVIKLEGVEFRCGGNSAGAQSIVPPSTHHTGKQYQWIEGLSLFEVPDVPELPSGLIQKVIDSKNGRSRISTDILLTRALEMATAGSRNDSCLWLGSQLRDAGYRQDEAEQVVQRFTMSVPEGDHAFTLDEALATTSSAYSRPAREPWNSSSRNGDDEKRQGEKPEPKRFIIDALTSEEFAAKTFNIEYDVKDVVMNGQNCIVGGLSKSLKTSALLDMAISMGFGIPWLGKFETKLRRVAFFSAESGDMVLQDTALRICRSKGVKLKDANARWGFHLPQLSNPLHVEQMAEWVQQEGIEVLILDPLYLCMLAGDTQGRSASNLFDVGPLLSNLTAAIKPHGCYPILIHHLKTSRGERHKPPELNDLAFAGITEFARQWILLSRRSPYEDGTGSHDLWMRVGGSAGHGGLFALDIEEGTRQDYRGREWKVNVQEGAGFKDAAKRRETEDAAAMRRVRVLDLVSESVDGITKTAICKTLSMNNAVVSEVISGLLMNHDIEQTEVEVKCGSTGTRKADGFKRVHKS